MKDADGVERDSSTFETLAQSMGQQRKYLSANNDPQDTKYVDLPT
jgi:hypothetical protein